jgi:hypothetical protein
MSKTVRLSTELYDQATEAAPPERSPEAQIERWATLGRQLEAVLGENSETPRRVGFTAEMMGDILNSIAFSTDRSAVIRDVTVGGGPFYEVDPEDSLRVVRIDSSGRRTRGHFENRTFIASE